MNGKTILYIDQWGEKFFAKTVKELQAHFGGRVSKMYADLKAGGTRHVGYVVGRHWCTAYARVELPA